MSKEIEIKVLEIDKADIIKKLKASGAKKVLDSRLEIRFFDFPDRRLTKKDNIVRLRREGKKIKVTVKDKIIQKTVKQALEYEAEVGDFESITKIFSLIGLRIVSVQSL